LFEKQIIKTTNSRIQPTLTKTTTTNATLFIQGISQDKPLNSRISISNLTTKSSNARIQVTSLETKSSNARLNVTDNTITKSLNSNIKIENILITKPTNSRLKVTDLLTKSSNARLKVFDLLITKSSNANLSINQSFTKSLNANLNQEVRITQSTNAYIHIPTKEYLIEAKSIKPELTNTYIKPELTAEEWW